MSIKMVFGYTLLLNCLIFVWYGVKVEKDEINFNAPIAEKVASDSVPILLLKEVDTRVLISKDS